MAFKQTKERHGKGRISIECVHSADEQNKKCQETAATLNMLPLLRLRPGGIHTLELHSS